MNKAKTLQLLENNLTFARVLPQITLSYGKYYELKIQNISIFEYLKLNQQTSYVVRSSFSNEDTNMFSNAGKFLSIVDIRFDEIASAIEKVFASYESNCNEEIVLIQPYLNSSLRSGVIFSHSPSTGQPYLIDNYVISSRTDEITSGQSHGFKHVCLSDNRLIDEHCEDEICLKLKQTINECQKILDLEYIDVEYAIDTSGEIYIFQVRPLIVKKLPTQKLESQLLSVQKFLSINMKPQKFISGDSTIYGVMPDWNPAEMIGRRPKQLALSLYRELITDSIWAYQRDNYGYKNLRSFPLLVELSHQPFIDTRVSFNSLLPKGLTSELEAKLVNHYLELLKENLHFHDKVEFEIILSSWTFELEKKLDVLPKSISTADKRILKENLINLTKNIIKSDSVDKDISRINNLINRQKIIHRGKENHFFELYWLLEDCKRWGTLPFAGLARAAFVATQIIKSLEVLTGKNYLLSNFITSINTVTSQMSRDLQNLDRPSFLEKYGHLRPGTYDITSQTYREAFSSYFGDINEMELRFAEILNSDELKKELENSNIDRVLGVSAMEFLQFAEKAIFWREQSKFEFTKNLSDILDLIVVIGQEYDIRREELSFLDIKDLVSVYSNSSNVADILHDSINRGKLKYTTSIEVELPSVITSPKDIFSFTESDATANFITVGKVTGTLTTDLVDLSQKIVILESADPGFDWIFQKNIKGLITAYGGANSHMAIRCSELNIPAVIGVGERMYSEIIKAHHIYIDCGNRIIEYK